MKAGEEVLIWPKSKRYPDAASHRGETGHILHIEDETVSVLVNGEVARYHKRDLLSPKTHICKKCRGGGTVPRLGIWQIVPNMAWKDCPDCRGEGFIIKGEENGR